MFTQAPAERRQVFRGELQQVGIEGAKVLRELGNKVKKMEKLGPVDILFQVHEAAEELQKKVDKKSYLLVNAESWEIGKPLKELGDPQERLDIDTNNENEVLEFKSLSEAMLDLGSIPASTNLDTKKPIVEHSTTLPGNFPSENMVKNQISWPVGLSFNANGMPSEEESKTYESASALSLATFTSLLIEFVARLQNLVDSFEELSEKACFKDPSQPTAEQVVGF